MKTKRILFVMIMILVFFPMVNTLLPIIKSAGLKGDIQKVQDTAFTWKGWFEGTYQKKKETYLNSNVGFYPDFIRINNQIDFSLFGILHAKDVCEGQNHFLYETSYIQSYLGHDKLNDSIILKDCREIKLIQDSLTAGGKIFLFVIATNKADYYPEHFPEKYKTAVKKARNYTKYLHYMDSLGIKYIDFNGYFVKQKSKTPYPLITKFSTHWSSYGVSIASDSIVKYLSINYFNNRLIAPEISYTESKTYNKHDKEAFDPLNLIAAWPDKELTAWPQYAYPKKTVSVKPKILFVADSYFWEVYDQKVMENVFGDLEFWYYNRDHWGKNHTYLGDVAKRPALGNAYLKKSDIVVMMASEFHMNCLTRDFITKLIKAY